MDFDFAPWVQPILISMRWLAYVVLTFYVIRVLIVVFNGKPPQDSHRLREAMALGYTFVAAYFIYFSTAAIQLFATTVLDTGSSVHAPPFINSLLVICAGLICSAFICNFCRSLWMLKLLDHAIFEPVPNWDKLTNTTGKLLLEFIPRAGAAVLFICLEFKLEKLGSSDLNENLRFIAKGENPPQHLTDAGLMGLLLYSCLITWWLAGRYFIKAPMPRRLLIFHLVGLVNSLFIFLYGGPLGVGWAWLLILVVGFMTVGALYMLVIVVADMLAVACSLSTSTKSNVPSV